MWFSVSARTVQRLLLNSLNLVYVELVPVLVWQKFTAPSIFSAGKKIVKNAGFWRKATFTDDEKWLLEGPDGYKCYWEDELIPRELFSKRVDEGTVLTEVSWLGKTRQAFLQNKQDAVKYCSILDELYQPYLEGFCTNDIINQ